MTPKNLKKSKKKTSRKALEDKKQLAEGESNKSYDKHATPLRASCKELNDDSDIKIIDADENDTNINNKYRNTSAKLKELRQSKHLKNHKFSKMKKSSPNKVKEEAGPVKISHSESDSKSSNDDSESDSKSSNNDSESDSKSSNDDSESDSKSSNDDSESDSKSCIVASDKNKRSINSTRNNSDISHAKKKKRDVKTIVSSKSFCAEDGYKTPNPMNLLPETKISKNRNKKQTIDLNKKDENIKYLKSDTEINSKKRKSTTIDENRSECKKKAAVEDSDHNLRMYIRGLPWRTTEDEIREYFSTCGEIASIEMPIMDDGRSSGTAIIDFKTKEACESCLELNGSDFNGRWLNIKYSTPKPIWSPREPSEKAEGCTTVFVGNLSFQIDEETLRDAFGDCGEITQVRFAEDRETGHFKGFGHIEFANTESTNLAVKMAGTDIMGRPVRVDYANPRKKSFVGARGRAFGRKSGRGSQGGRGTSSTLSSNLMSSKRRSSIVQFSGSKTTFE